MTQSSAYRRASGVLCLGLRCYEAYDAFRTSLSDVFPEEKFLRSRLLLCFVAAQASAPACSSVSRRGSCAPWPRHLPKAAQGVWPDLLQSYRKCLAGRHYGAGVETDTSKPARDLPLLEPSDHFSIFWGWQYSAYILYAHITRGLLVHSSDEDATPIELAGHAASSQVLQARTS